jgi:hypothetical protein
MPAAGGGVRLAEEACRLAEHLGHGPADELVPVLAVRAGVPR